MAIETAHRHLIFTADARLALAPAVDGRPRQVTGYALTWNTMSTDRGGFKVRLLPGSATFTTPTRALYDHDFAQHLASTDNGTLRLFPDDVGVRVEIDLPDTQLGRDVGELVRRRDIKGMSFGMVADPKGYQTTENGETILNAQSYAVHEVTVTTIPSFLSTTLDVKDPPPAAAPVGYAARTAQYLRLQKLKFDHCRLPGAELPGRTA
jgi:HK97 family phage prohead protease